MRIVLFSLMLMIIPFMIYAGQTNSPEYGFQFLQIPISPVAAALAGNGIYSTNYPGAFVLNPAANLFDETYNVSINHAIWLVDSNYSQLTYSKGNRNKHFGLSARVLDYGQIDARDDSGVLIGNYHPMDASLMTNFAYRIMPDHMLGVNLGMVYEKIESASSYGFSSDLGYVYLPPIVNTTIFASVRNMGFSSEMDKEAIKLPLTYEIGAGYTHNLDIVDIASQVALNKAVDTDMRCNIATEMTINKTIAVRLGYKFNYSDENLTAGIGFNIRNINVNYGWTSFSDKLNDTHTFGVTYNF